MTMAPFESTYPRRWSADLRMTALPSEKGPEILVPWSLTLAFPAANGTSHPRVPVASARRAAGPAKKRSKAPGDFKALSLPEGTSIMPGGEWMAAVTGGKRLR
jgi:hypothetical protein